MIVAAAFLIVRGPLERLLGNQLLAGLAFGAIAASEAIFPNARFPYASHTLACGFITSAAGWRAGSASAVVAIFASLIFNPPQTATLFGFELALSVLAVSLFGLLAAGRPMLSLLSIMVTQGLVITASTAFHSNQASLNSFWTIPANTFGAFLLGLVVRDARTRSDAIRHQREVAEARTLAIETELLMLRGRVHPHFLYNALTSIAALCDIAPKRASKAAINLGALMRQSLEQELPASRPLRLEMETVLTYAEIEMERFGSKLKLEVDTDGCEEIEIPPFAVQILVENAILHGVSPKALGGTVRITARVKSRYAIVGVSDDGVGIASKSWRTETRHGLNILSSLMASHKLPGGRLRLARRKQGTLAVLRIPLNSQKESSGGKPSLPL